MCKYRNKGVMMAMIVAATGCQAASADNLAKLLGAASRDGAYIAPAAREVEQAEALFQRCFDQCNDAAARHGWRQLGFEMMETEHGGRPLLVIRESLNARQGRGFFAFFPKSVSTTALQAPHSFKDENTREILLHLLAEGDFRAAAWNTVPRQYELDGMKVDADMAHLKATYFLAFSRAFARRFGAGKLVQLHGFAQEKRRSESGASAEMVISSGSRTQTPAVLETGGCLKRAELGEVRIYPTEIHELGATTNSSGSALRALGHAGFVHIEMSAPSRLSILNDQTGRARLLRCLEK
ncbi:MAG: hypothetical protein Q8O37_09685 [Sulfuricellaceae bacterium]|nr:hypothetical protein [Sulfuricellaceae bacterium]